MYTYGIRVMNIEELTELLKNDLKNAMLKRDAVAVSAIRCLISGLDNAGAVEVQEPEIMPLSGNIAGATSGVGSSDVPRRRLDQADVIEIIRREIGELRQVMEMVGEHKGETEEHKQKIKILESYLNFVQEKG